MKNGLNSTLGLAFQKPEQEGNDVMKDMKTPGCIDSRGERSKAQISD
jgi:hypothetical protein